MVHRPGTFGRTAPAFSLGGKQKAERGSTVPGPASYSIPNLDMTQTRGPAFKMGMRTPSKQFSGNAHGQASIPGPGAHDAAPRAALNLRKRAPAFQLSPRRQALQKFNTPGPGSYANSETGRTCVSTSPASPRMSILGRTGKSVFDVSTASPGPVYAHPSSFGKQIKGGSSASYSLGAKRRQPRQQRANLGPGAYQMAQHHVTKTRSPGYSFGGRTMQRKADETPGAGAYSIPSTFGAAARGKK